MSLGTVPSWTILELTSALKHTKNHLPLLKGKCVLVSSGNIIHMSNF